MKIVQINSTCGIGSTGKICVSLSEVLNNQNIENYIFYSVIGSDYKNGIGFSSRSRKKLQSLKAKILGNWGLNSKKETKRMIQKLEEIQPDIVHLHNIHGHDCNFDLLFRHFRKVNQKLIWTFHDCWAFTGYCTYFDMAKCEKWKDGCHHCVQRKKFSWFFDRSSVMYQSKKKALEGLDLTIVTPSQWLADLVKQSFLKDFPVKVINNGIDLGVFHRVESDFRLRNGLENKKIVLGVAFGWGKRKGLDIFIELSKRLPGSYQIVLVGTNDSVDAKLPKNILSIHRTHNQSELAELYTSADVFVNPTREENFPTVNIEALACGTPVVTFRTGGSPEIPDETCGAVVDCEDVDSLESKIIEICEGRPFSTDDCVKRASSLGKQDKFKEYIDLYAKMV